MLMISGAKYAQQNNVVCIEIALQKTTHTRYNGYDERKER